MNFRLLFLFVLIPYVGFSQCPPSENISFFQQEDLDSFQIKYPNCTEFEGSISIPICINDVDNGLFGEYSVYDLSPLSNLTSLGGISIYLHQSCWSNKPLIQELYNLHGLHNLTKLNSFSLSGGMPIFIMDELSQLTELENLNLSHTNISSVNFDLTILDNLVLEFNDNLNDISKISLDENIEELSIYYNERINEAPSLLGVKNINELTLGDMKNVDFLSSVEEILSLEFVSVEVDPDQFENLKTIGDLTIIEDENLLDLNFISHVNFNGKVVDLRNCNLTSLDGLDFEHNNNLKEIRLCNLPLENLDPISDAETTEAILLKVLPSVTNMPNLERLNKLDRLGIESMGALESLATLNVTDSLLQLTLNYLNLTSLEGLETLKSCESLNISRLNELESLEGLNNLNSLGGLNLFSNDKLKNLDALTNCTNFAPSTFNNSLVKLDITWNDNLISLDGISNWRGNWSNINIANNSNLTECSIPPICDSFGSNTWVTISNNKEGCNTDEEVKENCGYKYYMVFLDQNENGIKESDETGLPLGSLESDNGFAFYPNLSGLGDYNNSGGISFLEYQIPEDWILTSPESILDLSTTLPDTIFFGIYPAVSKVAYDVFFSNNPVICDREYSAFLSIENEGTENIAGTIELDLPGDFIYAPGLIVDFSSDVLVVSLDEVVIPGEIRQLELKMRSPSVTEQSLDSLLNYFVETKFSSSNNDSLVLNKHYTSDFYCAYDPNDKQVFPVGVFDENYTLLETEYLQYTIRFQNTGNFPATDIVIRDTLDANLDPSSLKVRGVSHPILKVERKESTVEFIFDNIFLPDSVHNEPLSHGFVTFTIELYPDIDPNTEITNEAHIYFDSNPPIVTNTTLNTMVDELPTSWVFTESIPDGFDIWPIPVESSLNVSLKEATANLWRIYNSSGFLVETGDVNSVNFQIDLGTYTPGIYFIKIEEASKIFIKF